MGTLMDVPMPLCQLENIPIGLPYNLQMNSHNFQHILSWQAKQDPAVPVSYNVLYRDSRSQKWLRAEHCSGIAQLSCELTQQLGSSRLEYRLLVQGTAGTQLLNSTELLFWPQDQTYLGPPEVTVTSCPNCINVTIKLPTSHYREEGKLQSLIDIYNYLYYDITLKSLDGEHKRPRQETTEEVFSTVIEELYPGRNYCVSVDLTTTLNHHSKASPWKCVTAGSEAQQGGYHEVAVAGAVCVSLIIAAVLKCMHAAGCIFQKISLPQTLALIGKLAYPPWVLQSERVDSVEIIPREVKSKARGCRGSDSDDDSDSDDSSALCDHDYTRREGLGRGSVPRGCASPSSLVQYSVNNPCEHSSSHARDSPAEPQEPQEHQGDPEGHTDSRVSGMVPKPRNARITSVNLHSTLQWDAPRFPRGNITYTVRFKSINFPGDTYETLRTGLRLPACDVSSLSAYGDYVLQLRAEAGQLHSPWLSLSFKPMDDTIVGPPEVRLKSESGALHVDFSGPFAEHGQDRWPLRQYYGSWSYRILCWKRGTRDTDLASASWVTQVDTKHSSEILSQLEPWTVYCVQVQAVIPEWNKTGELSRELCEQTTHNGVTPVWVIVAVLVGSMLVMVTAVTGCFFSSFYLYRLTKYIFCPSYDFPQHLKEFLSKAPGAPQPFPPLPQELVCDKLSVISEESQTLRDGSGAEASRTPEHPQDSAQGDSGSGLGAASGEA